MVLTEYRFYKDEEFKDFVTAYETILKMADVRHVIKVDDGWQAWLYPTCVKKYTGLNL